MLEDLLGKFLTDPALQAVFGGTLLLFAADFVSGIAAAIRRKVFSASYASNILTDQGPAVLTIGAFSYLAGTAASAIGVLAVGAAAAYLVTAQRSIRENLGELGILPGFLVPTPEPVDEEVDQG